MKAQLEYNKKTVIVELPEWLWRLSQSVEALFQSQKEVTPFMNNMYEILETEYTKIARKKFRKKNLYCIGFSYISEVLTKKGIVDFLKFEDEIN